MTLNELKQKLSRPRLSIGSLKDRLAGFSANESTRWITIKGEHVLIGDDGTIEKGPARLVGKHRHEVENGGVQSVKTFEKNGLEFFPVRLRRTDGDRLHRKLTVKKNGEIEVEAGSYWSDADLRHESWFHRKLDEQLSGLPENRFVRVTNKKEDYDHLASGTHRGSTNHRDNKSEGGLSVARKLEVPAKFAYLVDGEQISTGTDGEPLLDTSTAKPASKLLSYAQAQAVLKRYQQKKMKELGWTEEQYRKAFSRPAMISDPAEYQTLAFG